MRTNWSRHEKIGLVSVLVAVLGVLAIFFVPEVRVFLSLEETPPETGSISGADLDSRTLSEDQGRSTDGADSVELEDSPMPKLVEGFRFLLTGCLVDPPFYTECTMFALNTQGKDAPLAFMGASAVDDMGVDHLTAVMVFGNETERRVKTGETAIHKSIPTNTKLRAIARFDSGPIDGESFELLRFFFLDQEGRVIVVERRGVPIGP